MLPKEKDYFDHQDEHWVANPFIPDRQKIRMFNDMLAHNKNVGIIHERKRILELIKKEIKQIRDGNNVLTKHLIEGLEFFEGIVSNELKKIGQ